MRKILCFALLLWAAGAAAQDYDYKLIGAGVRDRPKVDGFSERTTELIPVLRYFGQRWYTRTTQGVLEGGARWNVSPGWYVGAQLAYEPGPGDRDPGASIGVHAEWRRKLGPVPVVGLIRLRQNVDSDRGLLADFRAVSGVYQGHGFLAAVFGQFTVASDKYYRAYYGVDESGLLYASLGVQAAYNLSRHWLLVGSAERKHMSDNAARSQLVVQRSASDFALGVAYNF
jgi:outer membrane scaffolding protein for murein synthesis (MipA/OmpV family)